MHTSRCESYFLKKQELRGTVHVALQEYCRGVSPKESFKGVVLQPTYASGLPMKLLESCRGLGCATYVLTQNSPGPGDIFTQTGIVNFEEKVEAMQLKEGKNSLIRKLEVRGTWVAQLVRRPTLAQVMISQFTSSSLGSVLTAQSLEPASDSVPPFLSVPPLLTLSLSLKDR